MAENLKVRCAAKAIIIENGKLLTIKKKDAEGFFYILPGGGQDHGETIYEGLVRECIEEISVTVKPERLVLVRDYIADNHGFAPDMLIKLHQLELMFLCTITEGTPKNGEILDSGQICPEWIGIDSIENHRLYPVSLKKYLKDIENITHTVYMGDVN